MAKKKRKHSKKTTAGDAPRGNSRPLQLGISVLTAAALIWFFLPRMTAGSASETYKLIAKTPHDMRAYTQGLIFLNGYFYESTGQYGSSSLRKVDPASGQILEQRLLNQQFFAEGLTYFKGVLVQLTWKSKRAFVYDSNSLELLRMFFYEGEGWGLTHDGSNYIMSDGSHRLYFREPVSFKVQRTIEVMEDGEAVNRLNELEFINGEIWANVYQTFDIVRISPKDGRVLGRIDLNGILAPKDRHGREDVLNGIAYDAENNRIFVTGKHYSHVYEIQVQPKAKGGTVVH